MLNRTNRLQQENLTQRLKKDQLHPARHYFPSHILSTALTPTSRCSQRPCFKYTIFKLHKVYFHKSIKLTSESDRPFSNTELKLQSQNDHHIHYNYDQRPPTTRERTKHHQRPPLPCPLDSPARTHTPPIPRTMETCRPTQTPPHASDPRGYAHIRHDSAPTCRPPTRQQHRRDLAQALEPVRPKSTRRARGYRDQRYARC